MTIYLSKILHTSYLDDGNIPDRSCQFETFWQAAGLTEKDETSKISTLIYAIGDKADDILTSFKLTKAQKRRYSVVRQKFKVYFIKPSLKPATKSLLGPNRQAVDVSSQFTGTLRHRDTMSDKEIFVVPDLQMCLLGCPAIELLEFMSRVSTIQDQRQQTTAKDPDLYQGLGKILGEYYIYLKI